MSLQADLDSVKKDAATRPPDFNRIARLYRWVEYVTLGPCLEWCRFAYLHQLGSCRRGLVLGDGDGRFTGRMLRLNPDIEMDAVDSSSAMLHILLRGAGPNAGRVRTHLADIRYWVPGGDSGRTDTRIDLVATHFFLDCLTTEEVESLAVRLRAVLDPSAIWLVSEFAIPEDWYGRWVAAPLIRILYHAFGLLTGITVRSLPDYRSALRKAGFSLHHQRSHLAGLLTSELWTLTMGP